MPSPPDLKYTKEHEWVQVESDFGTVGITDYAQDQLGDIVFVELPSPGKAVKQMEKFGEIESVKAVSELYSPVTGEVVEANATLADRPELVNDDPYGGGWMLRVRLGDPAEIEKLLSAQEYDDFIAQGAE
ncbi:MAG TPA: glycine cleavage system protein GcvH [Dehalococcoidia bacterium]|nr:glycine cleavage system protein GcvH [Dehalococcoidia bacterium]